MFKGLSPFTTLSGEKKSVGFREQAYQNPLFCQCIKILYVNFFHVSNKCQITQNGEFDFLRRNNLSFTYYSLKPLIIM